MTDRILSKTESIYLEKRITNELLLSFYKPYVVDVYKKIYKNNLYNFILDLMIESDKASVLNKSALFFNAPYEFVVEMLGLVYDGDKSIHMNNNWIKSLHKRYKKDEFISHYEYFTVDCTFIKFDKYSINFLINERFKYVDDKQKYLESLLDFYTIDGVYNTLHTINNNKEYKEEFLKHISEKDYINLTNAYYNNIRNFRNKYQGHINGIEISTIKRIKSLTNTLRKVGKVLLKDEFDNKKLYENLIENCDDLDKLVDIEPTSYDEIISCIGNITDKDINLAFQYTEHIDRNKREIYLLPKEEIIKHINLFKNNISDRNDFGESQENEKLLSLKENNKEYNELRPALKVLSSYDFSSKYYMDENEQKELFSNSYVFIHKSMLLKNDDQRSFIDHLITYDFKENNVPICIDYQTRLELFKFEIDSTNDEELRNNAKHARSKLSLLHQRGYIHYVDAPKGMTSSDDVLINYYAKKHRENRFVVLFDITKLNERRKFISKIFETGLHNIIVLLVNTQRKVIKIDSMIKPTFLRFCGYKVDDNYNENYKNDEFNIEISKKTKPQKQLDSHEVKEDKQNSITSNKNISLKVSSNKLIKETNELISIEKIPSKNEYVYYNTKEQHFLVNKIKEGGEGVIYKLDNNNAAKIYKKEKLTSFRKEKLTKMIEISNLGKYFCQPLKLLFNEEGIFVGYEMRLLSEKYMTLQESILQLSKPSFQQETMPKWGNNLWNRRSLVSVSIALSKAIKLAHENGLIIGDLNPYNIMVDVTNSINPDIKFVDFDSMQYSGYPCPVGTIAYTNPQIYVRENTNNPQYGEFLRTNDDDMYALAVMLFNILFLGAKPYIGKGESFDAEAMRNYNFSYKTKNNNNGSDAPDGSSRIIWNNTVPKIKELFSKVFELKEIVNVDTWINLLSKYIKKIDDGEYTNDLIPNKYFDTKNKDYCEYFKCDVCGQDTNMPKDMYKNRLRTLNFVTCPNCYQRLLDLKTKPINLKNDKEISSRKYECKCCGNVFTVKNYYDAYLCEIKPELNCYCKECNKPYVGKCKYCGKEIKYFFKVKDCDQTRLRKYCAECSKPYPKLIKCKKCGNPVKISIGYYNKLKKHNKVRFLCEDCLKAKRENSK